MTDEAEIDELFADTEKHMGYDLLSYNLYLDELKAAINALLVKAREEAENRTAEWFDNGVPTGYTTKDWLALMRIAELQKELEGE